MVIAGETLTLFQNGGGRCTFKVSSGGVEVAATASFMSIPVEALSSFVLNNGCVPKGTSTVPWIKFDRAELNSYGWPYYYATFRVEANPGPSARSGNIEVAGQPRLITQRPPLPPAPSPTISAIVTAAGFDVSKGLAPGGLFTIFGNAFAAREETSHAVDRWPFSLQSVSVEIDGMRAPLTYVSSTQINGQVPYSVPLQDVLVDVIVGNQRTSMTASIRRYAPSIFLTSDSWAIAQNSDWSVNSRANPAKVGSILTVYATGIGAVNGIIGDGSFAGWNPLLMTTAPVRVLFDGVEGEVLFAGLCPGFVGLAQVNARVPQVPLGKREIKMIVGDAVSNTGMIGVGQ